MGTIAGLAHGIQSVIEIPRQRRAALTRAAGRVAAGIDPSALKTRSRHPSDEYALPMLLEAQGVGALCGSAALGRVEGRVIDHVDDLVNRTLERGQRLLADRTLIRLVCDEAEVPFAPIKGAWIADFAYDVPEARPMADTDLFVGSAGMDRTTSALCAIGFRTAEETWKHRVLKRASDLHSVAGVIEHPDNPRPVELHAAAREAFRGIEGRVALGGTNRYESDAPEFDEVGQTALIAAHATVDCLGRSLRLVSIVDIARLALILPANAWNDVIERIPQPAGARFLYPSLELASRELGAPIPVETLATLRTRIMPSLAGWVDRQDIDSVGLFARGQVERALLEIARIWPLDAAEQARLWRFILWPRRLELADRYPMLAASRAWPLMYGRHAAFSVAQLRRRIAMRRKEPTIDGK